MIDPKGTYCWPCWLYRQRVGSGLSKPTAVAWSEQETRKRDAIMLGKGCKYKLTFVASKDTCNALATAWIGWLDWYIKTKPGLENNNIPVQAKPAAKISGIRA